MVKPRIHIRHGVWTCVTFRPFVCGCGYSPAEAYAEWCRIKSDVCRNGRLRQEACLRLLALRASHNANGGVVGTTRKTLDLARVGSIPITSTTFLNSHRKEEAMPPP